MLNAIYGNLNVTLVNLLLHRYNKKSRPLSYDINLIINSMQHIYFIKIIKRIVNFLSSIVSRHVIIIKIYLGSDHTEL